MNRRYITSHTKALAESQRPSQSGLDVIISMLGSVMGVVAFFGSLCVGSGVYISLTTCFSADIVLAWSQGTVNDSSQAFEHKGFRKIIKPNPPETPGVRCSTSLAARVIPDHVAAGAITWRRSSRSNLIRCDGKYAIEHLIQRLRL